MPIRPITEFEWITAMVRTSDGESQARMHYLVDPAGQVRADIEEPTAYHGRPSFISDLYWATETRYSHWLTLGQAKQHIEISYLDHLKANSHSQAKAKKIIKKLVKK